MSLRWHEELSCTIEARGTAGAERRWVPWCKRTENYCLGRVLCLFSICHQQDYCVSPCGTHGAQQWWGHEGPGMAFDDRLQVAIAILGFSLIQAWAWNGSVFQTSHSSNRLLSSFHTLCLTNGAIMFRGKKRQRNKRVALSNYSSFLYPSEASCSSAFQRSAGLLAGVS